MSYSSIGLWRRYRINYHNSGQCPRSSLLFKTWRFGDSVIVIGVLQIKHRTVDIVKNSYSLPPTLTFRVSEKLYLWFLLKRGQDAITKRGDEIRNRGNPHRKLQIGHSQLVPAPYNRSWPAGVAANPSVGREWRNNRSSASPPNWSSCMFLL